MLSSLILSRLNSSSQKWIFLYLCGLKLYMTASNIKPLIIMKFKPLFFFGLLLAAAQAFGQSPSTGSEPSGVAIGKFGTYYDQRELLFEAMPTSQNDIIFLGNSITDGGEWAELFQNANCKNRGISGDVTDGVLNRLETVTKGQPAMIFLMIGTNDLNWGRSNDSIAANLRRIIQRIKAETPRTHLVVQSILPTNDCYGLFTGHTKRYQDVALVNAMLKDIADEEDVDYLDLYRHFANEEGKMNPEYSNDGLHLNAAGYQLWKDIVDEEFSRMPKPLRKSNVPIWLDLSAGGNIVHCFDNGTIPYPYRGLGLNFAGGVTIEWARYHVQKESRVAIDMLGNGGTSYGIEGRSEFLYRFHDGKRNRLHLWAGPALQSYLDLKEISAMMNASLGLSGFMNLCAEGMLSYDFAYPHGGTYNLLTLYGKLSLPVAGLVMRPGYAYMDNYTNDINVNNTMLSDYVLFGKWLPGVGTDVGLYLNLMNGNRIGLSYRWDYLSTGHKGAYRFDNALHSFNLNFKFNLN